MIYTNVHYLSFKAEDYAQKYFPCSLSKARWFTQRENQQKCHFSPKWCSTIAKVVTISSNYSFSWRGHWPTCPPILHFPLLIKCLHFRLLTPMFTAVYFARASWLGRKWPLSKLATRNQWWILKTMPEVGGKGPLWFSLPRGWDLERMWNPKQQPTLSEQEPL